jgi:hypothetical protein
VPSDTVKISVSVSVNLALLEVGGSRGRLALRRLEAGQSLILITQ